MIVHVKELYYSFLIIFLSLDTALLCLICAVLWRKKRVQDMQGRAAAQMF